MHLIFVSNLKLKARPKLNDSANLKKVQKNEVKSKKPLSWLRNTHISLLQILKELQSN